MTKTQTIILVLGSCLVTFFLSVLFSIQMATISPENLAKVVKEKPLLFLETLKESARLAEREASEKALKEQFKNPLKIQTKGRVTFGKEGAPVTIVKFSDFQCPYCSRAVLSMSALREKYDGKVNLVYKHFPLSFHPFAKPAAEYFEAVALIDHEKARKFHDVILKDYARFSKDYARLKTPAEINKAIKKIIKEIGLDIKDVEKHLEAGKKVVAEDMKEADRLGVGGTPSFFVNGIDAKKVPIEQIIEKVLNKKS